MLKLFNSLTRQKEEFKPINPPEVGMYTCGPTVYSYLTIGNLRTFTMADLLHRTLLFNGYKTKMVMNITDVGHLTGDNTGNADIGEDRLEKAASTEGKTAWDIAKFYTDAFLSDIDKLNILRPDVMPKATDHIKEQIDLIGKIEEKGFSYKTSDGIYFDTDKYEADTGKKYGELSTMDEIKAGARVEENLEKKNPRDFALWKFEYPNGQPDGPGPRRLMEWESPWGLGFPGWHIECSAMSMKYLGETFDIHTGGEDLRQTHHPNEVAQSEAATGKKFVNYWMHTVFLLVDGKRMGKSLGNAYTLEDIAKKNLDPLSLRYLYLSSHYRDQMNFTWEALDAAQTALERLKIQMSNFKIQNERTQLSPEKDNKIEEYTNEYLEAINDDLNTPRALAVVWEVIKSNIPSRDKYDLILSFDEVLGLGLGKVSQVARVPQEVEELKNERDEARRAGDFAKSDELRDKIKELGFKIKDTEDGTEVTPD